MKYIICSEIVGHMFYICLRNGELVISPDPNDTPIKVDYDTAKQIADKFSKDKRVFQLKEA